MSKMGSNVNRAEIKADAAVISKLGLKWARGVKTACGSKPKMLNKKL